jgi:hypothetical protein
MNISPDGVTVHFKTEPEELFLAEKSGAKSNTVRILDLDDWKRINSSPPKKIIIQNQQEVILRTLTHICRAGVLLGKVIVIFSWTHEKQHHSTPEQDPYKIAHIHSMPYEPSIDERFVAITISKGTLSLIQSIAHGRTMNKVIQELYERYMFPISEERGPLHD